MNTVKINYLRKSNLFKASKWVSRYYLGRRICALLSSPLNFGLLLWLCLHSQERPRRGHGPLQSESWATPGRQWQISFAAATLSTPGFSSRSRAPRMAWPSGGWMMATEDCLFVPLSPVALSNPTGLSSFWVEVYFFFPTAGIKLARGTCMCACMRGQACTCVCKFECAGVGGSI